MCYPVTVCQDVPTLGHLGAWGTLVWLSILLIYSRNIAAQTPPDVLPAPRAPPSGLTPLLTVTSPSHDISRTHLEVFADGWDVRVTDLHSTNGTLLVAPGGAMRTMDPGETATVELGTSLELADGVSVLIDFPQ